MPRNLSPRQFKDPYEGRPDTEVRHLHEYAGDSLVEHYAKENPKMGPWDHYHGPGSSYWSHESIIASGHHDMLDSTAKSMQMRGMRVPERNYHAEITQAAIGLQQHRLADPHATERAKILGQMHDEGRLPERVNSPPRNLPHMVRHLHDLENRHREFVAMGPQPLPMRFNPKSEDPDY